MSHDDETPRSNRTQGGLSLDDRLGNIEDDIAALSGKLDKIISGLSEGATRFTTLELRSIEHGARLTKIEEGRDAVVRLIVFAVIIAVLGLIGLKVFA